jgi:hypothetical protein
VQVVATAQTDLILYFLLSPQVVVDLVLQEQVVLEAEEHKVVLVEQEI